MDAQYQGLLSEEETILEIRDAEVLFDMDRGTSRVLDDIDLDIVRNEVIGIVGESGSGKSMLANALLDAVPNPGILNGTVRYNPQESSSIDILELESEELRKVRWETISMVFQGAMDSFNPTMRIRKHFEETLNNHGRDIESGMELAEQLLSDLYLDPPRVLGSYPHELSGGMRQRALIALSLILEPEVLVLDEPTAALDLLMQRSILSLLTDLKEQYDLTLVFITHDLPLVTHLADRIAVMYAFQLVEVAPTDQILDNASHPYTRMLLQATPALDVPIKHMQPIEGAGPDPVNIPSGCSFHPRCPLATDECIETDPDFRSVDNGHGVACIHWEESQDKIRASSESVVTDSSTRTINSERSTSESPVLSINDLEVHFETNRGILKGLFENPEIVRAVDGVDLDIYSRDVVALVGESGCGKTTLGKAAIGLERPTDGTIEYKNQDIWQAHDEQKSQRVLFFGTDSSDGDVPFSDIRRALQIIHQDPGSSINPNKTVNSSLTKPLKKWNPDMGPNERKMRVYALLEEVGMEPPEDYAKRYPHQLSGGEQQRVALIRALLMNPNIIFADEPISALDVSLRVEMMDLFIELLDLFDTSYLFISHDLSNARYITQKVGGRIAVMYLGEIVEVGPTDAIIDNPKHPYTKALRWASPNLRGDQDGDTESPIRSIDIPDPTNPPEGCRFHTRCPEARAVCKEQKPEKFEAEDGVEVACFRADSDHEYWDSDPLFEE